MRYSEEKVIEMLEKGSVGLDNEDILELIKEKNDIIRKGNEINQELYEGMRERMDNEVRIAHYMGYLKAIDEFLFKCDEVKKTDFPCTNSVFMEDITSITDTMKSKFKELKVRKFIIADEIFKKFAGHSDYHGDTILSTIKCMAEGKEVESATPLNIDEIKLKAIKWAFEKIREKIKRFHYLGMFGPTGGKVKYAMCVEDCDLEEVEKYFEGVYSVQ